MTDKHYIYPRLEIISLHIAKTGGKSFVNILNDIFGNENVIRLRKVKENKLEVEDWSLFIKQEAHKYKVIHGHFHYERIKDIHLNSKAKIIIWIRDPVERVISRYLFLQKHIRANPDHFQKEKKDMSLVNFASLYDQRNVMSKYLTGIPVEDLFFVGILEQFEQSVEEFKQLLGITKKIDIPWDNDNTEYKSAQKVSGKEREIIIEFNKKDIKLYNQILKSKGIA